MTRLETYYGRSWNRCSPGSATSLATWRDPQRNTFPNCAIRRTFWQPYCAQIGRAVARSSLTKSGSRSLYLLLMMWFGYRLDGMNRRRLDYLPFRIRQEVA